MDPRQQPSSPPPPTDGQANQPLAGFQPLSSNPQQQPQPAPSPAEASQQPTSFSIDYLDQIAAPTPTTSNKSIILVWAIIGLSIVAAVVFVFMMFSGRTSSMEQTANVYMRMETLKKVSENHHKHLRDNQLRVSNRNFITFLTNSIRDIEQPLQAAGIQKSKLPKKSAETEASLSSELNAAFEDARLNINLDRVYTREMTFQISTLQSMMRSVYDQASSAELRGYLETTSSNLAPVSRSFSEFAVR